MNEKPNLGSEPAMLEMTIHITRKATGNVETYQLIGTPVADQKEDQNGSDPSDCSAQRTG